MTDKYDASNPAHRKIAHGIEVGDGIPEMRKIEDARSALKTVGFEVLHDEDLADRPDEIVNTVHIDSPERLADTAFFPSAGTTLSKEIFAKSKLSGTSLWSHE